LRQHRAEIERLLARLQTLLSKVKP
jgi:hypothetical protein